MKKISIIVPCYNEEKSIQEIYQRLMRVIERELYDYDYEIIYVDDFSSDSTREEIRKVCAGNKKVRAVFNARNFGFARNVFQSYSYASGDCAFMMFGDLQDPPEMLPEFVKKWEEGYKCVIGQRKSSKESKVKYILRKLYYKLLNVLSESHTIEMMNGFGLYDREFLNVLEQIEETSPFFKAIVKEYGINICVVPYEQSEGRRGNSNFNFWKNYDFAMHGITSSTKLLMRFATLISLFVILICIGVTMWVFIRKILFWDTYPLGSASIMIGVFFLGAVQLFFVGVLGEYILSINERVVKKPRTIVQEMLNFDNNFGEGGMM